MPLELRGTSKWWYGRYTSDGRRLCVNLGVKIAGNRPTSLMDEGDGAFERSRAAAQAKLDAMIEEAVSKRGAARLIEKLYEMKTGVAVESIPLADMADRWAKVPRRRAPSAAYLNQCSSILTRFAAFVAEHNPNVRDMSRVTPSIASAFLRSEEDRGVSGKTWNDVLLLLRSAFKKLLPAGAINPFAGIPTRTVETIFRKPFTPEELNAILKASASDPLTRPIIIAGMCTAMRRGDCCLLKWKDVDLANRFLNVKTAKTGQKVAIPIFPLLLTELQAREQNGSPHVFPEAAAQYQKTPLTITRRVQRVLAAAGFKDPEHLKPGETTRGEMHVKREDGKGKNRASVRDFHSFRVTWVTLALSAGVPLELVQKVTGHKTTDIVMKHYFQPGREAFRESLQKAMPRMITRGHKPAKERMRQLIMQLSPSNARAIRDKLMLLIDDT